MNMTDIAKLCGVSRQTVHAALNDKPGVSPETRSRILEVVDQYNYRPNRLATNLQRKTMDLVGLTILDIRNPFFAELVQGVSRVIRRSKLHLMFFETATKAEEGDAVETLLAYRAAGLILSPIQDETRIRHLQALLGRKVPLVSIGEVRGLETNFVEVDNREVTRLALQHLVDLGHRHVVYLSGPEKIVSARDRSLGFIDCLMSNRLPFSAQSLVEAGDSSKDGYDAAMAILQRPVAERPTALTCFNDMVALGAYEAAMALGLRIPEDVSIIGCDDVPLARLLGPPLTTIAVPVQEMGEYAAEMLLSQMSASAKGGSLVKKFQPKLVVRKSVGQRG